MEIEKTQKNKAIFSTKVAPIQQDKFLELQDLNNQKSPKYEAQKQLLSHRKFCLSRKNSDQKINQNDSINMSQQNSVNNSILPLNKSKKAHRINYINNQSKSNKLLTSGQQKLGIQNQKTNQLIEDKIFRIKIKNILKTYLSQLISWKEKQLNSLHLYLINDKSYYSKGKEELQQLQNSKINQYLNMQNQVSPLYMSSFANSFHKSIKHQNRNSREYQTQDTIIENRSKASFCQNFLQNKTIKQYIKQFKKLAIIQPAGNKRIMWEIFHILVIIVLIFFIPFVPCYQKPLNFFINSWFITLLKIFILLDHFICINTGYYNKGVQILNRLYIIKNWAKNQFFTDILSTAPFLILGNEDYQGHANYLLLLIFFKISRIQEFIRKFEELFPLQKSNHNIMAGVKLIYVILITSHIFSIIWLAIGKYQYDRQLEPNWYLAYELNKKEWISGYLISYYFNMVTMVTVGYGDIGPQSEMEMLLCIATMFISCAVFAYALNQIDYIFRELYMFESQIRENMALINNYMLQKNISKNLQFQIRQYLDYVWREQEKDQILDNNILMQLSDILQEKLLLEANKIVLIDSPVFKNNFSETIIQKTVPLIREQKCTPQENILIDNSRDNCSIYFIEKGEVEVYLKPRNELNIEKNQNLQILKKGDHFGTISFFTGQPQQFSIRSIQFSSLLMIKRQDFINLIQEYQEDYQKFCFIRDLITINSDCRKIHQKCYSCQSDYHQIDKCPFLHLNINRNLLMRKIAYNIIQERENKIRQYKKQFNLGQLQLINEKMIQFHEKENKALDEYELDNDLKLDEQNELVFSDLSFSEDEYHQYTQNNNEQNKNIIITSNSSNSSQSKNSINTIQEEDEQNNSSIGTENSSFSKSSQNQVIQEKNQKSYLSQKKHMNQTQSNEIEVLSYYSSIINSSVNASSGGSLGISKKVSQEYIQNNKNSEFDENDLSKSETSFSLQQSIMIDNQEIQQYSLKIRIWQELERQRKLNNVCAKSQNTLEVIKDDEQSICSNNSLTITSFSKNIKSYFYLNDEFNFSDQRQINNNNKVYLDYNGNKQKNTIQNSEQRKNLRKISQESDIMEKSQDNQISCFDKYQYPKDKQNFQGFNMNDDLIFNDNKQDIPEVKISNYDENKKMDSSKKQHSQQKYIQQKQQVCIEKQINSNLTKECLDKLPKNKFRNHNNINSKNSVRKIKNKEEDFDREDEEEILSKKQSSNYHKKKNNLENYSIKQSHENISQIYQGQRQKNNYLELSKKTSDSKKSLNKKQKDNNNNLQKRKSRTSFIINNGTTTDEIHLCSKQANVLEKVLQKLKIMGKKTENNQEGLEGNYPHMFQSKKRNSKSRISSLKKQQDLNQFLNTTIKHVKIQPQNLNSSSEKENDKQISSTNNLLGFSKQVRSSNISNKMNMSRSFAAGMNRSILKKPQNSPRLGSFNKSNIMNNKNTMSQSRMNPMMMSKYGLLNKSNKMLNKRLSMKFPSSQQNKIIEQQKQQPNQRLSSFSLIPQDFDPNNISKTILNALASQLFLNQKNSLIQGEDDILQKFGQYNQMSLMFIDEPYKIWDYYFPHNNLDKIIRSIKQKQKKKKKLHLLKDSNQINGLDLSHLTQKLKRRMHSQLYFDAATNKYKFPINHRKQINSNQANNNDKNNESDLSLSELENFNNQSEKISQMIKNTPAFMLKPRRSLKSQKFPDQINKIFFQNINSLPKINIDSNKNSNDDNTTSQYSQQFSLIQSPNNRIDQSLISKEQDSKQSNRPLLN